MANPAPTKTEKSDILTRAYRKIMDGKRDELTGDDGLRSSVTRRKKRNGCAWQYYAAIPQKHWRQMSGRQAKILMEQAKRYGIPFGTATISLPDVVRALHDFLAENKHRLSRDDDAMLTGPASPALERYREERAAMARLARLEREGQLLPRDLVRHSLSKTATILRNAGDAMRKQYGEGAAELLYEALDDAVAEIERFFANPEPTTEAVEDDVTPDD